MARLDCMDGGSGPCGVGVSGGVAGDVLVPTMKMKRPREMTLPALYDG